LPVCDVPSSRIGLARGLPKASAVTERGCARQGQAAHAAQRITALLSVDHSSVSCTGTPS
jgi:hypothetical protein